MRAAAIAASHPAWPAPTTTTSNCSEKESIGNTYFHPYFDSNENPVIPSEAASSRRSRGTCMLLTPPQFRRFRRRNRSLVILSRRRRIYAFCSHYNDFAHRRCRLHPGVLFCRATPESSFSGVPDGELMNVRRLLSAVLLLSFVVPMCCAADRGPSTPEEKARAVEITKKLEANPL